MLGALVAIETQDYHPVMLAALGQAALHSN
jgi:hypothetical protein